MRQVLGGGGCRDEGGLVLGCGIHGHTVDGPNPFTPLRVDGLGKRFKVLPPGSGLKGMSSLKPWETIVCWYLRGNRIIPGILNGGAKRILCPSTVVLVDTTRKLGLTDSRFYESDLFLVDGCWSVRNMCFVPKKIHCALWVSEFKVFAGNPVTEYGITIVLCLVRGERSLGVGLKKKKRLGDSWRQRIPYFRLKAPGSLPKYASRFESREASGDSVPGTSGAVGDTTWAYFWEDA